MWCDRIANRITGPMIFLRV